MLKEKLHQLVDAIKQKRSNYEYIQIKKETAMPMGKGTYGKKVGRPSKEDKNDPKMKRLAMLKMKKAAKK